MLKTNLAYLKSDVDKLDTDKLKNIPSGLSSLKIKLNKYSKITTPVDLRELSDIVKYEVFKETDYNELIKKFNNISTTDTSDLVIKKLIITQKLFRRTTKLLSAYIN